MQSSNSRFDPQGETAVLSLRQRNKPGLTHRKFEQCTITVFGGKMEELTGLKTNFLHGMFKT